MAEYVCPSCGKDLPNEIGQHATDLVSALVTCPHCGAEVTLRERAVVSHRRVRMATTGRLRGKTAVRDIAGAV